MKCPEKQNLMLFTEGELDSNEISVIQSHLLTCEKCQKEYEAFKSELELESELKEKLNNSFKKHSVANKITATIKTIPTPKKNQEGFGFNNWLIKLLVPSFALVLVLFLMNSGSEPITKDITGNLRVVSISASNSSCYVDGKIVSDYKSDCFDLMPSEMRKLEGKFAIDVLSDTSPYTLEFDGSAEISYDKLKMVPVFNDCKANIALLKGDSANVIINGKLSKIDNDTANDVIKEAVTPKQIKMELVASETITIKKKNDETPNKKESPTYYENESKAVEEDFTVDSEEALTSSESGDISIIDGPFDGYSDKVSSPFEDQQLGGL